jgi:hypothetical protein
MLFIVHHHHITAVVKYNPEATKNNVSKSHSSNTYAKPSKAVKVTGTSIAARFQINT